ncbi:AraC family transcriptional regulator [Camelimonas sp. ID_303_24]
MPDRPEPGGVSLPTLRTLPSALDPAVHPLHKARALVALLDAAGVDADSALAGVGLQARDLDNVAARMSIRQLIGVFRNAHALVDDPLFALRGGLQCHLPVLGYFGLLMLTSANWPQLMTYFERHRQLSTPALGVNVALSDAHCIMTYFDAHDLEPELFSFILDFHLGMALTYQRDLYGEEFQLAGVRLSRPRPRHADEIVGLYGAPVRFGAARNEIFWDRKWVGAPMRMADPLTAQALGEICDQLSDQIAAGSGAAGAVTRMLEEARYDFPGIDEVAARMHVTSRTLRRWLLAEGASYAGILDTVRARMAIRYLRATRMKTDEIARILGFGATASFRTAFRRWTGRQPSHFRPHSRGRGDVPWVGQPDGAAGAASGGGLQVENQQG